MGSASAGNPYNPHFRDRWSGVIGSRHSARNALRGWLAVAEFVGIRFSYVSRRTRYSVIATFREARVHGRLRLLIEAESLFNDGTASVAFGVAVLFATGHPLSSLLAMDTVVTVGERFCAE